MIELIEYIKLHILSLEQDYEEFYDKYRDTLEYKHELINEIKGQIIASRHILSVGEGILNK